MKRDIILSGVGGQGILSIAAVIGRAALEDGLHIKQAEVHGMSQRGGDVQSNLRIASGEIASDLIARGVADIIISLEPMEALRYLPWLSKEGWVITNTAPLINIPNYPEAEALRRELDALPHVVALDVDAIAKSGTGVYEADTLEELAEKAGIDVEGLLANVGRSRGVVAHSRHALLAICATHRRSRPGRPRWAVRRTCPAGRRCAR